MGSYAALHISLPIFNDASMWSDALFCDGFLEGVHKGKAGVIILSKRALTLQEVGEFLCSVFGICEQERSRRALCWRFCTVLMYTVPLGDKGCHLFTSKLKIALWSFNEYFLPSEVLSQEIWMTFDGGDIILPVLEQWKMQNVVSTYNDFTRVCEPARIPQRHTSAPDA